MDFNTKMKPPRQDNLVDDVLARRARTIHARTIAPLTDPDVDPFAQHDEQAARAKKERLYGSLTARSSQLLGCSVLTTRPHRHVSTQITRTAAGIIVPTSITDRTSCEYLLVARVLKVGSAVPEEDLRAGDHVLVPQNAGFSVYDHADGTGTFGSVGGVGGVGGGHITELWMLGYPTHIIARLDREQARAVDDDE